ncbi:PEP-CTERM sorting domain-containing protein [Massilia atriviolacea]|uniref:PEP-CTERM sorting domain-containing protein n=2 Tax=Massilia atriviolacea TaxID=2495579 RepID=A0A430HJS1_9BURK|nr:PEP-CTERM sorting domain-containing protein [Massilia atriviolacea]
MNKVLTYGGGSVQNGAASMHADLHIDAAPGAWGSAASASQLLTFTLSPSTRLLFTAEAEVLMQKDGIDFGVASALLSGSVGSSIDGVWGTESFNSKLSSTEGLRNQVLQGVLNTGAQIGRGSLSASLTTIFQKHSDVTPIPQDISAVPEPETYGMLLAGLLVVGSVARGKRRGQARQA